MDMKIFLHRNGSTVAYNDNRLKLIDTITGRTYYLNGVFWSSTYGAEDAFEQGRIHVMPTEETAREMAAEPDALSYRTILTQSTAEFADRFEPCEIRVGDWFLFNNREGIETLGKLGSQSTRLYGLTTTEGTVYEVEKSRCKFYATAEVPLEIVNDVNLRTPQTNDIVCLKSDVTKIGRVQSYNYAHRATVFDYYDNGIAIGGFEPEELIVLSKEREIRWGSFSGRVEDANNPRVRDGVSGSTRQIYPSIRNANRELRRYENDLYGIPETMKQYVPQLGRTVDIKRFKDGDWIIDMTVADHTTPQGNVEKTWYRAMNSRTTSHEKWLMTAMSNHKKVYEAMLQIAVPRTPEVSADNAAETAELLTATQRIEAAAARFRAEAAVREQARRLEEQARLARAQQERDAEVARQNAERIRREAEEAKKTIWGYHVLKPKVQNP